MTKKFELGQVVATPAALEALEHSGQEPTFFLAKHSAGDWGDIVEDDRESNEQALREGGRLVSLYLTLKSEALLVITEADRSVTTILLPDEY